MYLLGLGTPWSFVLCILMVVVFCDGLQKTICSSCLPHLNSPRKDSQQLATAGSHLNCLFRLLYQLPCPPLSSRGMCIGNPLECLCCVELSSQELWSKHQKLPLSLSAEDQVQGFVHTRLVPYHWAMSPLELLSRGPSSLQSSRERYTASDTALRLKGITHLV